ncbi:MAG: transcriptional regulator [Syntrophus sp. (in: bacteria)]|nr:transcriptional regulator [Syntrophus sp. (in: bacteria)]
MPDKKAIASGDSKEKRRGKFPRKQDKANKSKQTKHNTPPNEEPSIMLQVASLATHALRVAAKAGDLSWQVGKSILLTASPENAKMMQETGACLKDLRELAGLTRSELSGALDLSDQSLLEAVENGTATLSFELILRLAAVLARHDPVPFIIRFTRTYNPEIWGVLEKWGIGRIPVHFERERQFINIYRSQDAVRKLSDESFQSVLHFTNAAFEMALHFISQQQSQVNPDIQDKKAKRRSRRRSDS